MKLFTSFRKEILTKTRLEAFSDGVFAIIVTLLILDIKVPSVEVHTEKEISDLILLVLPKIITWIISFILVSVAWVNHNSILERAKKCDYGLMWINGLALLSLSFVPFPTSFLGEHSQSPTAITFFALSVSVTAFLLTCMRLYVMKYLSEKTVPIKRGFVMRLLVLGPFSFIVAALLSWINIYLSYLIFFIGPIYFLLPKEQE